MASPSSDCTTKLFPWLAIRAEVALKHAIVLLNDLFGKLTHRGSDLAETFLDLGAICHSERALQNHLCEKTILAVVFENYGTLKNCNRPV